MVFPVVIYGCESWTTEKAECWGIDGFELWCWRKLLRVPWTGRWSNQWILKEISPEYSLERLMLKLKLQYFGHLMGRTDSLEKTLMLGKTEGRRRREWQRMRWLDDITDSMDMSLSKLRELVVRKASHVAVHGVEKSRIWLSDWTELNWFFGYILAVVVIYVVLSPAIKLALILLCVKIYIYIPYALELISQLLIGTSWNMMNWNTSLKGR